ncbi:MAG: thiosulfohydrolase SoxB, partial [Pseudomonadota bacterium]|nr:thiosulfohydrolase SoxB [Pseudomonadota bacterium]
MSLFDRRDFLKILGGGAVAGTAAATFPGLLRSASAKVEGLPDDFYNLPMQGNARILHTTDIHGQLYPVYFREPNVNLGIGPAKGRPPHVVGKNFLDYMGVQPNTPEAYAYTYLDFDQALQKYGRMGGYPQLVTLLKQLREQAGGRDNTLTLDGGDLWQGSATSLWTRGVDMVEASNILGVDVMVGHWEFTYKEDEVLANVALFKGDFIGQNVKIKEESLFDDAYSTMVERYDGRGLYDEDSGHAFQPYVIKNIGGARICIIGQAFPRTANANPQEFFPDWSFGLREDEMIELAEQVREEQKPDAMVLLSHNGMDVDLKMAERVPGLNAVFGGHTHDGMPKPVEVKNAAGNTCLVTNAGSHGKFVGVMDFDIGDGGIKAMHYRMLPVFEQGVEPDKEMEAFLAQLREKKYDENIVESRRQEYFFNSTRVGKSFGEILDEKLAIAGTTLYRRGNFMGTWDQVLCDALLDE